MNLEFFFNFILIILVLKLFKFSKTGYSLGYSLFIFIISFIYFNYLGFEFIALAFIITYIGGIAVMFLFLILVLDVNTENEKQDKEYPVSLIFLEMLTLSLVLFFSMLLIDIYNPFIFNNILFYDFLVEKLFENIESSTAFYGFDYSMFYGNFKNNLFLELEYFFHEQFSMLNHNILMKFSTNNNFLNFLDDNNWSNSIFRFSDLFALGILLYKYYSIYLIIIAFFLLVALIVSIYVGSGVFNLEKY